MSGIDIYVRHRSDGAMLSIHLDKDTKAALIAALEVGRFAGSDTPISLELSMLPEWLDEQSSTHMRIPITEIIINSDN